MKVKYWFYLFLLFLVLKVTGLAQMSLWLVLFPIYFPFIMMVIGVFAYAYGNDIPDIPRFRDKLYVIAYRTLQEIKKQ